MKFGLEYEIQLILNLPKALGGMQTVYVTDLPDNVWDDWKRNSQNDENLIKLDKVFIEKRKPCTDVHRNVYFRGNLNKTSKGTYHIDVGNFEINNTSPKSTIKEAISECNDILRNNLIEDLLTIFGMKIQFGLALPKAIIEDVPSKQLFCTKHLNIGDLNAEFYFNMVEANNKYFQRSKDLTSFTGISLRSSKENLVFKSSLWTMLRYKIEESPESKLHVLLPYQFNKYDNLLSEKSCLPSLENLDSISWNFKQVLGNSKRFEWESLGILI